MVDSSITRTREHLSKNASPVGERETEVKAYNFDDSRLSNQFDIVIRDQANDKHSDYRHKISELEREALKLDKIKTKFNETMHKSIKLATFNHAADNPELGVLESRFPSTINSQV